METGSEVLCCYYVELDFDCKPDFLDVNAEPNLSKDKLFEILKTQYRINKEQVLMIYHESDTPDGLPFVIDYDHSDDGSKTGCGEKCRL